MLLLPFFFRFACSCSSTHPPVHVWGRPVVFCPAQSSQSLSNLEALPRAQRPPPCGLHDAGTPASPLNSLCTCLPALACLHPQVADRRFPSPPNINPTTTRPSVTLPGSRLSTPYLSLPAHLGSPVPGRLASSCLVTTDQGQASQGTALPPSELQPHLLQPSLNLSLREGLPIPSLSFPGHFPSALRYL